MSEPAGVQRFRQELERREGAPVTPERIVVLPNSVHTAALAAEALGCDVGAIANSLLFAAHQQDTETAAIEPVLILTSGAHRVDTAATAARIGVDKLTRATPEFVREHTGQVIGGVSPIAHDRPIATYLDPDLAQYAVIWAAAGHPAAVFSIDYAALRDLTDATEVAVVS